MSEQKKSSQFMVRIAAQTDVGLRRQHNEDAFAVSTELYSGIWTFEPEQQYPTEEELVVAIVVDGMGGLNAGEVAARIAIESVQTYFTKYVTGQDILDQKLLEVAAKAIQSAHQAIRAYAREHSGSGEMGTTIVLAVLHHNFAYITWVGDSRAYLFRPSEGLTQLSEDHSLVQELVNRGAITKEQAFFHPDGHVITQSLGDDQPELSVGKRKVELFEGDLILLCSDGLNGMLQDVEIEETLARYPDKETDAVEALITAANAGGGIDNITVVLLNQVAGNALPKIGNTITPIATSQPTSVSPRPRKPKYLWWVLVALFAPLIFFVWLGADFFNQHTLASQDEALTRIGEEVVVSPLDTVLSSPDTQETYIPLEKPVEKETESAVSDTPLENVIESPLLVAETDTVLPHTPPIIMTVPEALLRPSLDSMTLINRFLYEVDQLRDSDRLINGTSQRALKGFQTKLSLWNKRKPGAGKDYLLIQVLLSSGQQSLRQIKELKSLRELQEDLKKSARERGFRKISQYRLTSQTDRLAKCIAPRIYIAEKQTPGSYVYLTYHPDQKPDFETIAFYYGMMSEANQLKFQQKLNLPDTHMIATVWELKKSLPEGKGISFGVKEQTKTHAQSLTMEFISMISL